MASRTVQGGGNHGGAVFLGNPDEKRTEKAKAKAQKKLEEKANQKAKEADKEVETTDKVFEKDASHGMMEDCYKIG